MMHRYARYVKGRELGFAHQTQREIYNVFYGRLRDYEYQERRFVSLTLKF